MRIEHGNYLNGSTKKCSLQKEHACIRAQASINSNIDEDKLASLTSGEGQKLLRFKMMFKAVQYQFHNLSLTVSVYLLSFVYF